MNSPATLSLTARRLTAALLSGLALLLISVFIFQPASAQREPASLKPPFKFNTIAKTQPMVGIPPLPLNAPIIISETFDANYVSTSSLAGIGWHTVNFDGNLQGYSWGRVFNSGLMTDTAWIAQERFPVTRPEITPGTPYSINLNSLLIYGPINMSDYSSAIVSATYFLDVHPEDAYGLAYSLNGTDFTRLSNEYGRDQALSARRTTFYSLPPAVARQNTVWLAFYFESTNHPIDALGVFLDEVVVRGVKLHKVYLPIVSNDPTPTPTPTVTPTATPVASYLYDYGFGTGLNTSNQNFLDWGAKVTSQGCTFVSPGTSCAWGQDLTTGGNPEGALQVYQNGLYSWAAASPNNLAPTNFEFSADIFVVEPKKNARFGLIFGASTNAFGRDGSTPTFDPNRNLYKFDLQFDEVTDTIIQFYRLEACQTSITACSQPVAKTNIPSGFANNVGGWNNIKVQRQGTNIKVYLNNNLLINITDSTHTGSLKYGVFLQSKDFNSTSNPLKIRVDNVRIKALP